MKKLICIFALCLALVGCAGDTQDSSDEVVMTTTTTAATTEAATTTKAESSAPVETSKPEEKPKPVEKMAITAEVLSYKDGILTFKYEDKEYSLPLSKDKFDNDSFAYYRNLSEKIIDNKFGETVYAKMSVTKDMGEILLCDVVKTNGEEYYGEQCVLKDEKGNNYIDEELIYFFKRGEGSLCEISNKNETLKLDLNDLDIDEKLDYPETAYPISFHAYKFKDGKMFLTYFSTEVEIFYDDPMGVGTSMEYWEVAQNANPEKYDDRVGFLGVIQSVSDDSKTVTVLLNDKKTLCTVPTYYNDGGEIKEGAKVMVMILEDESLFGSGGEHEYDYAIIITDSHYYLSERAQRIFEDLAYGIYSSINDSVSFANGIKVITIKDAEKALKDREEE